MGLEFLYNTIVIQKTLEIKNKRLGLIFRGLQLCIVGVVFVQIFLARSWNSQTVPVAYGLEMWTGKGTSTAHSNAEVDHCAAVTSLQYNYSSEPGYQYMPTDCKPLPVGENFVKNGLDMYFPTFVQDDYVIEKAVGSTACASLTCSASETKTVDADECKCSQRVQFFAKNVEENVVYLNHGFAVDQLDILGARTNVFSQSVLEKKDYTIKTVITMHGDRENKCQINGKSDWYAGEILHGPIKDWIKCGGSNLDERVDASRSKLEGESGAPPVRIQGLSLAINLLYTDHHSEEHEGPVCYVTIGALPIWNGFSSVAYTQIPKADDRAGSYRARYSFGISVAVQASGVFNWFDLNALLLVITSSVVLLSMPQTIVQMIALNAVGRLSKIYSSVAAEKFSVIDRFHSICAKLLGYKASFEHLTASTMQMNADELDTNMHKVLEEQKKSGVLQEKEIQVMTRFMMGALDTGETGFVSLPEYLNACDSQDPVKLNDLAAYFDADDKGSVMERCFGDVRSNLNKAMDKSPALQKLRAEMSSSSPSKVAPTE